MLLPHTWCRSILNSDDPNFWISVPDSTWAEVLSFVKSLSMQNSNVPLASILHCIHTMNPCSFISNLLYDAIPSTRYPIGQDRRWPPLPSTLASRKQNTMIVLMNIDIVVSVWRELVGSPGKIFPLCRRSDNCEQLPQSLVYRYILYSLTTNIVKINTIGMCNKITRNSLHFFGPNY